MTIFYIFLGLVAVRVVLGSRSGTAAALVTIVAGVALCDAVGGGWFGWLLAGLLFLLVALVRNPVVFAQAYRLGRGRTLAASNSLQSPAGAVPPDAYDDVLLSSEEMLRLALMFPESDWKTAWEETEKTRRLLTSLRAKDDSPECATQWEECRQARQQLASLLAAGGTPDDGCTANPGPPRQG